MSLIDPQIPKEYQNGNVLFEQNLDAWRESVEDYFAIINLNLTQLRKDAFLANYDFDNDGNANLPKNLQQQINDLTNGSTPIGGTTSDTWTINSDGNSAILSSSGLTASQTYTFPDVSGVLVTNNSTQTLTNKTLTSPTINNATFGGVSLFPDGSAGAPSISYASDTDTGYYRIGNNNIGVSLGGVKKLDIASTLFGIFSDQTSFQAGTVGAPGITFDGALNDGFYLIGANNLGVSTNGTLAFSISNSALTVGTGRQLLVQDGSAATPSFAFTADSTDGIYHTATSINFSINGTGTFSIGPSAVAILNTGVQLRVNSGAIGNANGIGFVGENNSGIFLPTANEVVIACTAVESVRFNGEGALFPNTDPPTANYMNRNSTTKAWCTVDGPTGTLLGENYNIDSVSRTALGTFTINLDTNHSTAQFPVWVSIIEILPLPACTSWLITNAGSYQVFLYDAAGAIAIDHDFSTGTFGTQ